MPDKNMDLFQTVYSLIGGECQCGRDAFDCDAKRTEDSCCPSDVQCIRQPISTLYATLYMADELGSKTYKWEEPVYNPDLKSYEFINQIYTEGEQVWYRLHPNFHPSHRSWFPGILAFDESEGFAEGCDLRWIILTTGEARLEAINSNMSDFVYLEGGVLDLKKYEDKEED